jgi:Animal haem peroxidase
MRRHGNRAAFYIAGEGIFREPDYLSGAGSGCPVAHSSSSSNSCSSFRFGRMFGKIERSMSVQEWDELFTGLIHLGLCMNDPKKYCNQPPVAPPDSDIPAGYTYLAQFIAHEITFDNTADLPTAEPDPQNLRSPAIDLDSLYGPERRDEKSEKFYEANNSARLKVDWTVRLEGSGGMFQNDLPREEKTKQALIADERNDENLAVAQTQIALMKFHNKVVDGLTSIMHPGGCLFDCARMQVIRHFQWIILHDFLPKIVDPDVLDCVVRHGPKWFRCTPDNLYMPLEFSAAGFRLGHSMVRNEYQWNKFHSRGELGAPSGAVLAELFEQTAFSGRIGLTENGLPSDWIIDWRRFYNFANHPMEPGRRNRAGRIDTNFDFHLDQIANFPPATLPIEKRSITVRNLLRGFALGLPTGEEVAERIGEERLSHKDIASGPYEGLLKTRTFRDKTPLWFYILKEAELNGGNRLGRVGSRIVAETLVGLIKNSRYSVLDVPEWRPKYTERKVPGTDSPLFEMVDLLQFADVLNPLGP